MFTRGKDVYKGCNVTYKDVKILTRSKYVYRGSVIYKDVKMFTMGNVTRKDVKILTRSKDVYNE
jgi:hypothetical protein